MQCGQFDDSEAKVQKTARILGGGPLMFFLRFGPPSVHVLQFVREFDHPKRWVIVNVTNPLCLPIKLHGLMLAPRALCPFQGGGTGTGVAL